MKKQSFSLVAAVLFSMSCLCGCLYGSGAVGAESVAETLASPTMAVTANNPGWLLDEKDIHPLSAAQVAKVKAILTAGEVREVPERYYRDASAGNRGDNSDALFYLYASNAQCLGGRVLEDRVMMDDFNLCEEAQKELFTLLHPQLKQLLPTIR